MKRRTQRTLPSVLRLGALLAGLVMMLSACAPPGLGAGNTGKGKGRAVVDPNGPGVFDPNSTMYKIQQRGKLLVGTSFSLKPFSYENEVTGSPEGYDIELAKWIAQGIFGKNLEGKIDYIELDPRDRELALQQGKVDIVVGRYDVSAARKRFVDFAGPYFVTHQVVLASNARNISSPVQSLVDLNGRKICVVRGSTNVDALTQILPGVDTTTVRSSVAECGVSLLNNSVAAIAADSVDAAPWMAVAKNNVRVVDANYGALPYGVGIKKSVNDLRQYSNDRITAWKSQPVAATYLVGVPGDLTKPQVDRY